MKKIMIIPDSFKGTLSAEQICQIITQQIQEVFPQCQVTAVPVADGGEGTVSCLVSAMGGISVKEIVCNPFFEEMQATYGIVEKGNTAVIEMAACAGLPLAEGRKNPLKTTTYGVGQLILSAVNRGCRKIIIGLGGSCTNDAGAGAAAACGVRFYDKKGQSFIPVGGTLSDIAAIDISGMAPAVSNAQFITMCDIDNPPYGEQGAAVIFAPQKGADKAMTAQLDNGVRHICDVIYRDLNDNIHTLSGGGAAGAMGAGMAAFFHSKLQTGIDTVLDLISFEQTAAGSDFIITGEGKVDTQSIRGKVIIGVSRRARKLNIPVIVLTGGADEGIEPLYDEGICAIFPINRMPEAFAVSRYKSAQNLRFTIDNILRLMKNFHQ